MKILSENYNAVKAENYQLRDYIISLQSRLLESGRDVPPIPSNIDLSRRPAYEVGAGQDQQAPPQAVAASQQTQTQAQAQQAQHFQQLQEQAQAQAAQHAAQQQAQQQQNQQQQAPPTNPSEDSSGQTSFLSDSIPFVCANEPIGAFPCYPLIQVENGFNPGSGSSLYPMAVQLSL